MKNNQKQLENLATKVINKIPSRSNDNFGFVVTVLMVISIILTLVRVIQECDKQTCQNFSKAEKYQFFSEKTKSLSVKRTWFTKMTLKKIIRREINNKDNYRQYGYDLMNAILDTGEHLTEEEIKTLVETMNNV